MRRRRPFHPLRLELPGRLRLHRAYRGARAAAPGAARGARRGPRMKTPARVWIGFALIGVCLAALPFALAYYGTAWVRIANFAVLYVLLALGLNIVVGFAGLLDLDRESVVVGWRGVVCVWW